MDFKSNVGYARCGRADVILPSENSPVGSPSHVLGPPGCVPRRRLVRNMGDRVVTDEIKANFKRTTEKLMGLA